MSHKQKNIILIGIIAIFAIIFATSSPISQNLDYHQFIDQNAKISINNFWNVVSNLAFLFSGSIGFFAILKQKNYPAKKSWLAFYMGVLLVAPGSAYYHLEPNNYTLVWDRLPMTVGFMGLISALVAIYIEEKLERLILPLSLALGLLSVIVWHLTDDLRLYYFVQFAPLALIPIMAFMYRNECVRAHYLILALLFYVLAKIAELKDELIFELTNQLISGHTLKHYLAAIGPLFLLKMLNLSNGHCSKKISLSHYPE